MLPGHRGVPAGQSAALGDSEGPVHSQDTGRNNRLAAALDKAITQIQPPERGDAPSRALSQGSVLATSLPQAPGVTTKGSVC